MQAVLTAGDVAKALSAIIALLTLVLFKPVKDFVDKYNREFREQKKFREFVTVELRSISDDIGDLQYQSLAQAHDMRIQQEWCSSSDKAMLVQMHKSYKAKGRNHLSDKYEEEILELPERPVERRGGDAP